MTGNLKSKLARTMGIPESIEQLNDADLSRVIEMAWEDRTPFEAIETLYRLDENAVIKLMRRELKARSFRLWRKRVSGRSTKHRALRAPGIVRGYCPTQYKVRSR